MLFLASLSLSLSLSSHHIILTLLLLLLYRDVVKTRLMNQAGSGGEGGLTRYKGVIDCFVQILWIAQLV